MIDFRSIIQSLECLPNVFAGSMGPMVLFIHLPRGAPWATQPKPRRAPSQGSQSDVGRRYGGFLKWGRPWIIHFNGNFPYEPSIWGYLHMGWYLHFFLKSSIFWDLHFRKPPYGMSHRDIIIIGDGYWSRGPWSEICMSSDCYERFPSLRQFFFTFVNTLFIRETCVKVRYWMILYHTVAWAMIQTNMQGYCHKKFREGAGELYIVIHCIFVYVTTLDSCWGKLMIGNAMVILSLIFWMASKGDGRNAHSLNLWGDSMSQPFIEETSIDMNWHLPIYLEFWNGNRQWNLVEWLFPMFAGRLAGILFVSYLLFYDIVNQLESELHQYLPTPSFFGNFCMICSGNVLWDSDTFLTGKILQLLRLNVFLVIPRP